MAQVCGDSSYDYLWDRQHDVALHVIRRAADLWANGGAAELSSDAFIAVLLRIYLSNWPEPSSAGELRDLSRWDARSLESWLQLVTTARQEMSTLRPNSDASVLDRLDAELSFAVKQWTLGNSELPPTADAINAIEHILFSSKLTRRPPNRKMPTSLLPRELSSSSD
jgi:hypothetical protein